MLKSKMKKIVNVQDWNDFVEETYGKIYNFQQQDGCKDRGDVESFSVPESGDYEYDYENDEIPSIEVNGEEAGVSFKSWLNQDERFFDEDWKERLFWERNFYPHISMIINDLYARGLLKAGKFSIEIDW